VSVAIGRDGDLLFIDGAHRLAIAQLLDVPSIPVEVRLRHAGWMAFRRDVGAYCAAHGGMARQPLLHPDLQSVPSRPGWDAVYDLVARHLGDDPVMVVDLEARWGYLCHRMEMAGIECVAVETDSKDRTFLRRLRRACGRRFTACGELKLAELPEKARRDGVVLALASDDRPAAARLGWLTAAVGELAPREAYVGSADTARALLEGSGAFDSSVSLGRVPGMGEVFRLRREREESAEAHASGRRS
jgi:hypothetical protein